MDLNAVQRLKLDTILAEVLEAKVGIESDEATQAIIEYRRQGILDRFVKLDLDGLIRFARDDHGFDV